MYVSRLDIASAVARARALTRKPSFAAMMTARSLRHGPGSAEAATSCCSGAGAIRRCKATAAPTIRWHVALTPSEALLAQGHYVLPRGLIILHGKTTLTNQSFSFLLLQECSLTQIYPVIFSLSTLSSFSR